MLTVVILSGFVDKLAVFEVTGICVELRVVFGVVKVVWLTLFVVCAIVDVC